MTLTQQQLREHAVQRLRRARPDLADRQAIDDPAALLGRRSALVADPARPGEDGVYTVVVLRDLFVPAFVHHSWSFAASLAPRAAADWRAVFTRTVFLAGNPLALRERFAFDYLAEDGTAAWFGPCDAARCLPLRRLLKPFAATIPAAAVLPAHRTTVTLPGAPAASGSDAELLVATSGLTAAQLLIHVNHLVAEAALDGLLEPGDSVTLRQVPRLIGLAAEPVALRVDLDPADPARLQAFAALTRAPSRA